MKTFIALAALASVAFAVPMTKDSCSDCKDGVMKLGKFLASEKALMGEQHILDREVCMKLPEADRAGCRKGIETWGPKIAPLVFENMNLVGDLCMELGACTGESVFSGDKWSCDSCKQLVGQVGDVMASDDGASEVTQYLDGSAFCGDSSVSPDAAACMKYVDATIPASMKVLGNGIKMEAEGVCKAVYAIC